MKGDIPSKVCSFQAALLKTRSNMCYGHACTYCVCLIACNCINNVYSITFMHIYRNKHNISKVLLRVPYSHRFISTIVLLLK